MHNERGIALSKMGRYEDALASFDAALELDPDNEVMHSNRGECLFGMKMYEDALASLDAALELDPKHPHIHNEIGSSMPIILQGRATFV